MTRRLPTWFYPIGAVIVSWLVWLLGGARVEGLEHVPRSGALVMAANHASLADPPIIGWAVGHQAGRIVHFMAKIEVRSWPLIGWLASQSGVFFVRRGERDRGAQIQALAFLRDGEVVAMFPEGTRSHDGRLQPGRPGAAFLALRSGAPVLPVAIAGTQRLFPRGARMVRRTRMTVRIGAPFSIGHQPEGRLDRDVLSAGTERIMAAIAALLPPEQGGTLA
ncbi:MAG: lysophospholipid acyltransferase family protein [Candidatus Limnocylindria bacterium]